MDRYQTNRVRMFKTTAAYLDQNHAVWSSMAPLATAVEHFKDQIAAIDAAAQKQETPTGAMDDKTAARDALEDVLFLACEAMGALAHTSNNNDLHALTDVSPSDLGRLDDEEISNRASTIVREANARKTELVPLLVTDANLTELGTALERFNATKTAPRAATAERMAHTSSLPGMIRDASGRLRNQIDRMVNLFRRSNPQFVAGYRGARVIVDSPGPRTTPIPAPVPKPPLQAPA